MRVVSALLIVAAVDAAAAMPSLDKSVRSPVYSRVRREPALHLLEEPGVTKSLRGSAPSPCQCAGMEPAPYRLWWNVGGGNFTNMPVCQYGFEPGNSTQTGGACSQISNCTSWSAGLWPSITDEGGIVNGGVPQAGNLTAHLQYIQTHISGWIPDPNWTGNAVFDFEDWVPLWVDNDSSDWYHGARYQNYSRYLVQSANPSWNASHVEAVASAAFQTAAMDYFVQTLQLCTSLRPQAKWGFYGFPSNDYLMGSAYHNPIIGPILRALNDQLAPVWAASTALYPSIYMPAGTNSSLFAGMNADYVTGTTQEGVRVANLAGSANPPPVRPFGWSFYHDAVAPLLSDDLYSELYLPLPAGADGVVLWGAPDAFQHGPLFLQYLSTTLGPMALNITSSSCKCAVTQCSAHGACVGNATAPACRCSSGWTGATCNTPSL